MWTGIIFAVLGVLQLAQNFASRHDPAPPNSRLKLPVVSLLAVACIYLAASGTSRVVLSIAAAVLVVEIGMIIAGRNPWWMWGAFDKKEHDLRYTSAPPSDIDRPV
jgi:hypothetical protein